jgi:hypothetical protein
MFVMPPDISSDSDDGDSKGLSARQNVSISSDSASEQSENVGDTIDYLNRRVRLERDQLLQTAESRARSSQSLHHSSAEQSQPHRVFLKPQPRRRVAFAASPSSKTSNPHVLPHELKHVHIIAETERRWKNLPEVRSNAIQMSASILSTFWQVQSQMLAQEAAKSREASRQKAKLDAEVHHPLTWFQFSRPALNYFVDFQTKFTR